MELTIECQKREPGSKPRALRRSGLIPANLYGHKGAESISLTLKAKIVENLLKQGSINNTLINLNIPDIAWRGKTILREVQIHPAKGSPYHLSFFAVAGQESLDIEVPLHFVGDAVGVKLEGGVLEPVLTHLQVSCAPNNIPDVIEVDISQLHVKDILYVHQIVMPEGVTDLGDPDRTVATVLQSKTSVESEAIVEADAEETATETKSESESDEGAA